MIIRIKKVFFCKICKLLALMFYLVASVNYGFKGEIGVIKINLLLF